MLHQNIILGLENSSFSICKFDLEFNKNIKFDLIQQRIWFRKYQNFNECQWTYPSFEYNTQGYFKDAILMSDLLQINYIFLFSRVENANDLLIWITIYFSNFWNSFNFMHDNKLTQNAGWKMQSSFMLTRA